MSNKRRIAIVVIFIIAAILTPPDVLSQVGLLSKFLDPKLDLTFKKIFGTEKNKNILIHFLNDILGLLQILM
ncbi:MAG: twin-arginine translocase subunit TatC, partial [Candidatus Tisiphia sp.]